MNIEILKQAFKEVIIEVQQEEKQKTTVLTAHEAADILRISYRTLLNRIHSGKYRLFTAEGYQYKITLHNLKKYL